MYQNGHFLENTNTQKEKNEPNNTRFFASKPDLLLIAFIAPQAPNLLECFKQNGNFKHFFRRDIWYSIKYSNDTLRSKIKENSKAINHVSIKIGPRKLQSINESSCFFVLTQDHSSPQRTENHLFTCNRTTFGAVRPALLTFSQANLCFLIIISC